MRKITIFVFFLILMTASLRLGDLFAILVLGISFLFLYDLAEQIDRDN